ncbi:MAG: hypothetical protein DRN88_04130 [Candidatus Hydrothermarchaeota archaeon]|nr:MAG: hypothetical protein DRN88_04130 [Candidatus Hydrothermarchaeota archaeon]
MFSEDEFYEALQAYKKETSSRDSNDFTYLRKNNAFFNDIKSKEDIEEQIKIFVELISKMDRDNYANRYVIQVFILEFCKYLDKDFLFNITDSKLFFELKELIKKFTNEIYENNKKFMQNLSLHSLEHLLEDYGTLLKYMKLEEREEKKVESIWPGNKLW